MLCSSSIIIVLGRVREGEEMVFANSSNQNLDYEHREQFDQVSNTLLNHDWLVQIAVSKIIISIYRGGNFVNHHWGCTSIISFIEIKSF